jgi:hypothetical protein
MATRAPFQLRWLVVLWNAILAVFSILGALTVVPTVFGARARAGSCGAGDEVDCSQHPATEYVMAHGLQADLCDDVTENANYWFGGGRRGLLARAVQRWVPMLSPPRC